MTDDDEDNLEGITRRMKTFQVTETLKIKKEIRKVECMINSYNDHQESLINQKFEQQNQKFEQQNQKFEKMQEQLETLIRNSQK